MAEETSYYAIVERLQQPGRAGRRPPSGQARPAANATRPSAPICSGAAVRCYTRYERGDLTNDMVPISEEEADRIVARIRRLAESGA